MRRDLSYYARRMLWSVHHSLPEHEVTIKTENGLLTCSSSDWLVGKILYTQRKYETDFIRESIGFLIGNGLLPAAGGRSVADIGANVGMISIALLNNGLFDKAIAFEPSPGTFELLKKNVTQNGLAEKSTCLQIALSSQNSELELEIAEENSGDSRIRKTSRPGQLNEHARQTVEVPARTFDSLVADGTINGSEIDLFWIDIQGHEGHFFRGAQAYLAQRKVPVVNEFWGYGIDRSGMSRQEYIDIVRSTFDRFYLYSAAGFQERPILGIDELFRNFSKPRQIANIILI